MKKVKLIKVVVAIMAMAIIGPLYTQTAAGSSVEAFDEVIDRNSGYSIQQSVHYVNGGKQPYVENGVTYYYSDNVIEYRISLPKNTNIVAASTIVKYDSDALQLVTSFGEIRNSFGSNFINENWGSLLVNYYSQQTNQILISGASENWKNVSNTRGGNFATLRFRVKDKSITNAGSTIRIENTYQFGGNVSGSLKYVHAGYNPDRDSETYFVSAAPVVISAHKEPITKPIDPEKPTNPEKPIGPESPINPDIEYKPDLGYEPDKILEEVKGEIIEIVSERKYSFKLLDEKVAGVNSYKDIASSLIAKSSEYIKDLKTYAIKNGSLNGKGGVFKIVKVCYVHYIYIGLSLLIIFITFGYGKYLQTKKKVEWRNS